MSAIIWKGSSSDLQAQDRYAAWKHTADDSEVIVRQDLKLSVVKTEEFIIKFHCGIYDKNVQKSNRKKI